ncbi:MAG: CPBP family intramembrane glutamic endopeptidase [Phycisphaerales bacterium]
MQEVSGNRWCRSAIAAIVALGVFLGLGPLVTLLGIEGLVARQVALKGLMILVALLAWLALRQPWSAMGWTRFGWTRRCWRWLGLSCLAMAAAAVAMILNDLRHPLASQLSFLPLMAIVWFLSSFAEEVYVRGAMQSWCQLGLDGRTLRPTSAPIVASALLFAAMHVPLIWKGGGPLGGGIIVAATLFVGWGCAVVRARTGSVWAPFVVHALANMAAVPGGIVGAIAYRIAFGTFPTMQ